METSLIKLVYKQVIDASSTGDFEQHVFNASYEEFLLKSQAYNLDGRIKTFTGLKTNDGRANSLHYKLSFVVGHFIERLNNTIPLLKDNLENSLPFETAKFELIESDITDKSAHKVAVNYITQTLTLCSVIGEYLVLAKGKVSADEPAETFTVKMQPNLSVISYQLHSTLINAIPLSALYQQ